MEELNKIISGLYAKIDNQEKIIRDLQEGNKQLKVKSEVLEENNKLLIKQKTQMYEDLDIAYEKIDKAIEILKLCNSQCSKEVIEILKGDRK